MAATIEQRVQFLQNEVARIEASINEQMTPLRDELVQLLDAWLLLERAWLANPRDRDLKQRATDARQAYGTKRGSFTTALQALLDQADVQRDAAWAAVKDNAWVPPS